MMQHDGHLPRGRTDLSSCESDDAGNKAPVKLTCFVLIISYINSITIPSSRCSGSSLQQLCQQSSGHCDDLHEP